MRKLVMTVAAAALFAAATNASAETGPSVVVRYADLDLSNPAGLQTLEARIDTAVDKVCGGMPESRLVDFKQGQECRSTALKDAMAQVSTILAQRNLVAVAD